MLAGHCAQENINSLPPQHNVIPYSMKVCSVDISQPQAHSVPGISLCFFAYVTEDQNDVKKTVVHM